MVQFAITTTAFLLFASSLPAQYSATVMAAPPGGGWCLDCWSPGHAFICLSVKAGLGVKEDCFGFYPSTTDNTAAIVGSPALTNEFKKNPRRFRDVTWSLTKPITEAQRRAFFKLVNEANVRRYRLLRNNCGHFVDRAVAALGWKQSPVFARFPDDYVRNLYCENVKEYGHSQGRFVRNGAMWNEFHVNHAGGVFFTFQHKPHDAAYQNLHDPSRKMLVRIPIKGGWMQFSYDGQTWNNLYQVTPNF